MGTGEAAFFVAEKLAFHQFGRDRAAVDRHKRAGGARAFVVDGACHQFFADARLAGDVHGGLAAGDLGQGGAQFGHGRRLAQQACGHAASRCCGLAGVAAGRAWLAAKFQRVLNKAAQHGEVHRLADKIEGTGFQCANCGFLVAESGDHRHRGVRVELGDLLDQFNPGAVGQAHIGQAERVLVVP